MWQGVILAVILHIPALIPTANSLGSILHHVWDRLWDRSWDKSKYKIDLGSIPRLIPQMPGTAPGLLGLGGASAEWDIRRRLNQAAIKRLAEMRLIQAA